MEKETERSQPTIWHKERIEREKSAIKAYLDRKYGDSPKGQLRMLLESIKTLKDQSTPLQRLRCYIYIVSTLLHHKQHKDLTYSQIGRLLELGEAILKLQGIRPRSSKLSFLYGELHLAASQIYRQTGAHWKAAWEQQIATYLSQRAPCGGKSFQSLSLAIRALRLGHAKVAIQRLTDAEAKGGLSQRSLVRGRIEHCKALRLSGRLEESLILVAKTLAFSDLTREEKLDLKWERLCTSAIRTENIDLLVESVLPKGSHHDDAYILEAFLWIRATRSRKWLRRFPKLRKMGFESRDVRKTFGFLYECILAFEKCYDSQIPVISRLKILGKILSQVQKLQVMEKELLVWAAASRWLARIKADALASLSLSEYESLSLRLSGGTQRDALGILSDALVRSWFEPGNESDTSLSDDSLDNPVLRLRQAKG